MKFWKFLWSAFKVIATVSMGPARPHPYIILTALRSATERWVSTTAVLWGDFFEHSRTEWFFQFACKIVKHGHTEVRSAAGRCKDGAREDYLKCTWQKKNKNWFFHFFGLVPIYGMSFYVVMVTSQPQHPSPWTWLYNPMILSVELICRCGFSGSHRPSGHPSFPSWFVSDYYFCFTPECPSKHWGSIFSHWHMI